jgi:hypothetical protein
VHKGPPELETLRQDAIRALEIPDEQALIRAATRGELEARVLRGQQAQAAAPEPAHELRATALAEAEAKVRAADPDADEPARAEAASLADVLAGQRAHLEAAQADYERWSAGTAEDRESASQAKAELEQRHAHQIEPDATSTPEPETPAIEPEPEPEASPEADLYEPEAAELEFLEALQQSIAAQPLDGRGGFSGQRPVRVHVVLVLVLTGDQSRQRLEVLRVHIPREPEDRGTVPNPNPGTSGALSDRANVITFSDPNLHRAPS